jgi:SOS-response transcriptional repressor LexA
VEIKDRIRKFREAKGFSTHKLSEITGISQSTISKLENGKRKSDMVILNKIANALEVSTERLTGESASNIIEEKLEEIGMTLSELAEKAKVPIKFLENLDDIVPDHEIDGGEQCFTYISSIAWVLGIRPGKLRAALARQEIPAEAYDGPRTTAEEDFADAFESNIIPTPLPKSTRRIPVLGKIPAGYAIEAVEDILEWIDIPETWTHGDRWYFGLKIQGDSMYPEYLEDDTVVIRKQSSCDSGDDCAVMVNDTDATLKKVRLYEDGLELEAINPMYGKKKFNNEEVRNLPVSILGVVVELRRKKK